jgi:prolyl oligopeptidase
MRKIAITLLLCVLAACATTQPAKPPVPVTATRPVAETLHGVTITDPYRWLEDQESPETREWINRQTAWPSGSSPF